MKKTISLVLSIILLLSVFSLQGFAAEAAEEDQELKNTVEKTQAFKAKVLSTIEKNQNNPALSQFFFETGMGDILNQPFMEDGGDVWTTYEYHEQLRTFMDMYAYVDGDGNRYFANTIEEDSHTIYYSIEKIGLVLQFGILYEGYGYENMDVMVTFDLHPYDPELYCELYLVYYLQYSEIYDYGTTSLYIDRTTYNPTSRYGLGACGSKGIFDAASTSTLFNTYLDALISIYETWLRSEVGISFRQLGFLTFSGGHGDHVCDPASDYHLGTILNKEKTAPGCTTPGKEAGTYCSLCYYYVIEGAEIPAAGHKYSNACDTSCNECNAYRTVPGHTYDNACDADCNECGYTRGITPGHQYDDDCDSVCNRCSTTRKAPHKFSDASDLICDECGYERPPYVPGDLDENDTVSSSDAIYLLYHTLFGGGPLSRESARGL